MRSSCGIQHHRSQQANKCDFIANKTLPEDMQIIQKIKKTKEKKRTMSCQIQKLSCNIYSLLDIIEKLCNSYNTMIMTRHKNEREVEKRWICVFRVHSEF